MVNCGPSWRKVRCILKVKRMLKHTSFVNKWIHYTILICLIVMGLYGTGKADPGRTHFLLLDSRIVDKTENAMLTLGVVEKHEANPLFVEDQVWEKRFDNLYGNVIYDEHDRIYKCWYSPFIVDYSAKGMSLEERDNKPYEAPEDREMGICYAVSEDGINWEKPNLGLVEYNGSKANNIIWRGIRESGEHWNGPHGSGIFKDDPDPDPNRRYKAILKTDIISVAFSADGIRWNPPISCPEADVAGDTHNNAFWAPTLGKYVGISRSWGKMGREVVRIESNDFLEWTKAEMVLEGISEKYQTYAMPVFYYGGIYIGLVAIHDQEADRVWTELTWSPDTKEWNRVCPGIPLIPCSETILDYDYGCVYPCAYPVFLKDEIRLYYGGSDYLHFGWRTGSLCLATLRPDGFAGYEQKNEDQPAIITTSMISCSGKSLSITADVGQNGTVKVSILDANGKLISNAKPVSETVTGECLVFEDEIKQEQVRLRFELSNAKLYSFKVDQ